MKRLIVFLLTALLMVPCLTGCLLGAFLLDDEVSSSSEETPYFEEGEPDLPPPIDAASVISADIYDWAAMTDEEKLKWSQDVMFIWQDYYGIMDDVTPESVLEQANTSLSKDTEQTLMFILVCEAQGVDPVLFYPQTDDTQPAPETDAPTGYDIHPDASALAYDIFDWQLMTVEEHLTLMSAFNVIWQVEGIQVNKTEEELLIDVTAELQKDSTQAIIFDVACASQGIDPESFYVN